MRKLRGDRDCFTAARGAFAPGSASNARYNCAKVEYLCAIGTQPCLSQGDADWKLTVARGASKHGQQHPGAAGSSGNQEGSSSEAEALPSAGHAGLG